MLWGVNFLQDAVKWEANRAYNKKVQTWRERRQAHSASRQAAKEQGRIPLPNLNPLLRRKRRRGK
jgi:hypothetical protein